MPGTVPQTTFTCARCLRASARPNASSITARRHFSRGSPLAQSEQAATKKVEEKDDTETQIRKQDAKPLSENGTAEREPGAMSRRLAEATEDALLEGGRAGRRAVEDAGFSEELKDRLLEKVRAQKFGSENATAFAEAGLSSHVGRGSRDIAASQSWTGTENTEDTVLRMLDDARKPLRPESRGSAKIPLPIVDLRLQRQPRQSSGERLANARDKTSIYAISKDTQMTDKERAEMKAVLKERFTPAARAMPNSFRGLAALANERIEDAIARGQFKNIPRGKTVERDARADNPFIDTTEYIMNKMIQRQEIVPPWIEKQQELVKAAHVFRARLRNDWKRHAARTIASRGGSLQEQMRRADQYAESERVYNPRKRAVEQISIPTAMTDHPVMVKITQEVPSVSSPTEAPPVKVSLETDAEVPNTQTGEDPSLTANGLEAAIKEVEVPITDVKSAIEENETVHTTDVITEPVAEQAPLPPPFRIPSWEASEMSYLTLAIQNLNSLTRSYNLMAPDLAKKPYFSLERELKSCYAEVAPELSRAIKERASRPSKELVEIIGHRPGSVMERFGVNETAKIYDSRKPHYGFKEFWQDLFRKEA
ncbi:hypothetical protein BP6252_10620 [Coleophoma cylindrospora]|uniref:DnaJ homologue subfamily C member 28 conserved domain-containing protein n=1 Tax=Coleophoma cylindrospora TaxID=1849047 RepID=A0A3D8QT38_9HELO|nr:hypothetical protein BP6252_10620 [Coleophoma cylindrospora]